VRVKFLLGPAGSGKTFRCLQEVRAELKKNPGGKPLVFLAPKQATFQIERQLLADNSLQGFTRLNILSFDRLAQFVFEKLNLAPPKILSAEGRIMVLRALLRQHQNELQLFGQSARRSGFAQELSTLLAELQQHQFTPIKLRSLAENKNLRAELKNKLSDFALILENYQNWLKEHDLQDANHLLDFATEALRKESQTQNSKLKIQNLFLDGFAEMTPQELDFLAAVIPFCEDATLAFCLETESAAETSWLSIWSAIGKTFQQCRARLQNIPDCKIETETLRREPRKNRFAENPELSRLEKCWAKPPAGNLDELKTKNSKLRIFACQNPEAEAVFAAREVLKFVRAGNRFRDCAVLVRNLENYHKPLARTFRRYGIPFFLDRRESVAHHPLAELTRSALRTGAGDWQNNEDWFAALKAGFCPADETEIDRLENAALEFGWRGKKWREQLPDENLERLREKISPPFENLSAQFSRLKFQPTGAQLADFIRELWRDLKVEKTLENWNQEISDSTIRRFNNSPHATVWDQMNSWLDNLALAFPREPLALRDWLPILDAGLAGLTVGVIPPTLDEVLVGAIDRARNPNLKFALVLGLNESVFPAAPDSSAILTNSDRDELDSQNVALGPNIFDQLARERYLGYIACTRANEKLTVTFSRQSADGKAQNPSPFIAHIQKIFPKLETEEFLANDDWREAQNAIDLIKPLEKIIGRAKLPLCPFITEDGNDDCGNHLGDDKIEAERRLRPTLRNWGNLLEIPALKNLAENLAQLREPDEKENLPPAIAERLYGKILKSSVSRLEEFAQCPFRFFIHSGLRATERKIFELDARERGSFQHEVLKFFHEHLVAENKRWRDISPAEARERIAEIAAELMPDYRNGLLNTDAQSRFDARVLTFALQDFVGTLVAWMRGQYEFDPLKAELEFGFPNSHTPAWEIDLGGDRKLALRGKIDRIDLHQDDERTLAVVTDYKSSAKKLDKILVEHGIQLQLLAYLAAVRNWPSEILGAGKIIPAGVFYVNLRGQFDSGDSRTEALENTDEARRKAYRHSGRFDASLLDKFDHNKTGDQFSYKINQDGSLRKGLTEALPRAEFQNLLDQVETQLRKMGESIFSGAAQVDPYRKGTATACDYCKYQAACRIDPWTHQWRVLRATSPTTD
jgi:ATP-dependent helicase/nuclease subunit B